MRTLISFLGRGPYRPDGSRSEYLPAVYRFIDSVSGKDWHSAACRHFAFAAYQYYCHLGRPFEKIVLLGTAGSMWDSLADSFGELTQNSCSETALNLSNSVDHQAVTQSELNTYAQELSSASLTIFLQLIPSAADLVDQSEILTGIADAVTSQDSLYLDVTHGYRHLPMLGMAAATLVSSLRNADIEDIAYGALDMTKEGITPVISLKWIQQLFRVLNGVNELTRRQTMRPIIECFPPCSLRNKLEEAAYKLDVMRIDEASRTIRECLKIFDENMQRFPVEFQLVSNVLRTRLEQFSKQERTIKGLTRMAELALDQDEFLRTAVFLSEALEIASEQGIPGDDLEDSRFKAVRNWLAHAGKLGNSAKDQDVRECVANRSNLRKFFQEHIQRLKRDLREFK